MLQKLISSWNNNRGNWLLLSAALAGALMCATWYFQLLPDVKLVRIENSSSFSSRVRPQDGHPVVVTLRLPASAQIPSVDSENEPGFASGVVELLTPEGELEADREPLFTQTFQYNSIDAPIAVVFADVRPADYALVAYLDLNGNSKLDFNESNQPSEPFRTSAEPKQTPKSLDLNPAAIEVTSLRTALIEFDFN